MTRCATPVTLTPSISMELTGTVGMILQHKGSHVWTLSPDTMVYEAIETMTDQNIGALLVVDNDRRLLGIVSERDYTRKIALKGRSSKATAVRDIMTQNLVTVTPSHPIDECMRLMTRTRIRYLPVLDEGILVGMVSMGDLVKWIMGAQEMAIDQLEKYIVGEYPA